MLVYRRQGRSLVLVGRARLVRVNPWRTLKGGRRVELDPSGRILGGDLPRGTRGAHVRDLSALLGGARALERVPCQPGREVRYSRKGDALRAVLAANPDLADFLERTRGHHADADAHLGDFARTRLNRRGRLRGFTWRHALTGSIRERGPLADAWARLRPALEAVTESPDWAGGPIAPPAALLGDPDCEDERQRALDDLFGRARRGRLTDEEEAPF